MSIVSNSKSMLHSIRILLKRHVTVSRMIRYGLRAVEFFLKNIGYPCLFHDSQVKSYQHIIKKCKYSLRQRAAIRTVIKNFSFNPKISLIVPIYNVQAKWLQKCIKSVLRQYYNNFELCLYDDASTNPETAAELKKWSKKDPRIKIFSGRQNLNISIASNKAIELSTGDYIGFLDHDDELAPDALFEMVKILNEDRELDFIYSDEDKIESCGHLSEPHFKPDFNLDYLLCINYICHFVVIRRSLGTAVGWFRAGYEGAQDYDLNLRIIETTKKIYHIPRVLYHWRKIPGSTAIHLSEKPYVIFATIKALNDYLVRNGILGEVTKEIYSPTFRIRRKIIDHVLVSIVIPFRDRVDILKQCISSIFEKTTYRPFEIILVSNNSTDCEAFAYVDFLQQSYKEIRFFEFNQPFNYSKINNFASARARGKYVLFLNNDTEVLSNEWLSSMVEHIQREEVGAVGAKLLYPNGTIQHAGVILGLCGGVAEHAHRNFSSHDHGYFYRINSVQDLSAVTGACLLTKHELFSSLGGFNERNLPIAYNDVDYCLRLREKKFLVVYTPYALLTHHESATRGFEDTPEKIERFCNEVAYMKRMWGSSLERDMYYNQNLTQRKSSFDFQ